MTRTMQRKQLCLQYIKRLGYADVSWNNNNCSMYRSSLVRQHPIMYSRLHHLLLHQMYFPAETEMYSRYVSQTLTRVLLLLSTLQRTSLQLRLVLSMIVLMYILQVSKKNLKQKLRHRGLTSFLRQHLQQIPRQTLEHSFRKQKMQEQTYCSYLSTIRKHLLF